MRTICLAYCAVFAIVFTPGCGSVSSKDPDASPGGGDAHSNADASSPCSNGTKDGNETDVDCGGSCGPCSAGKTCATGNDCASGNCPGDDLVCCDTACDSTCQACTAAKTGGTDGTCAPVTTNMDPDTECTGEDPSTCGVAGTGCNGSAASPGCNLFPSDTVCAAGSCAAGTATESSMCDGAGNCMTGQTTSCSPYTCDSGGTTCLAACGTNTDCVASAFCNSASHCAPRLKIALQAEAGSCLFDAGDVYARVKTLLEQRGHTVTFVSAADIDTAAEINAYDVVVLGGPGGACAQPNTDWPTIDSSVDTYVRAGGGLVAAGWSVYSTFLDSAPKIQALLPAGQGNGFISNPTVTPLSGSSISNGLSAFVANQWAVYGTGAKMGAATFLTSGTNQMGEAWTVDTGRVVYLGPMYFEAYQNYDNEDLLDGTKPDAIELMLRAIEWAGGSL